MAQASTQIEARRKIPRQPECNVGSAGHVDHGKTSMIQMITGVWASAHSEELKRGITIKVGYADAAFYKCHNTAPPASYSTLPVCPVCGRETELLRCVSFVDCPGHESLMTNMLAGAALMDGSLLVIAANEPVPRPQTREHLQALQMLGMKKIVVVQNKIDLIDDEAAKKSHDAIKNFISNTVAADAPIIPISAQHNINGDALIEAIEQTIPTPKRDPAANALMHVLRSFDVNKPGIDISSMVGGVLGGSLVRGRLHFGDEIEIIPGLPEEKGGKFSAVTTKVESLGTGAGMAQEVGPGGLVAVGTQLDPSVVKADLMVGSLLGKPGTLPPIWSHVKLDLQLFESAVGSTELVKVEKVRREEVLRLNVGTASVLATVTAARESTAELELRKPVAAEANSRAAVSRRIAERWRLIGSGVIE
ncbi:MAG: translation initiation factor IF-2 subunit gamma [Thaumarchaeota archaeon]|nr:translation initiation factor IF-2 subunit gamma [Nitrososphaerota archaeon]